MQGGGRPLIAGAGPVGLAAALFLARQGCRVRIIDSRNEPSTQSKALAVNPRTLELLERTGVTARMLERGLPIRGVHFSHGGRLVASFDFRGIHRRYPFMLALSQAASERLLENALRSEGIAVERGRSLMTYCADERGVSAVVESDGCASETIRCPWLLGADGAHSTVRREMGAPFEGTSFEEQWHLADVPLKTTLEPDHGHVFFLEHGEFQFLIRVVDDIRRRTTGDPLWRVFGNRPGALANLRAGEPTGAPVWESSFHISHKISRALARDRVYLAGDAAHVHSPVGARGMNLGIEDAAVFAALERAGRLSEYHGLRYKVDRSVVRRVELLSKVAASESRPFELMRNFVFGKATRIPLVRSRMLATVTGLDHELPPVIREAQAAHAAAG